MPAKDRRRIGLIVSAAAVSWWITLGLMAALTANPVVLNLAQFSQARLIIEGRLSNERADTIDVLRVFACDTIKEPSGPLSVVNLDQLRPTLKADQSYLVPLHPTGEGTWKILGLKTLSPRGGQSRPIIYPADDVTREQLEEILRRSRKRNRQSVMVTAR
ncbi:MAG: hypothetical protein VB859_20095 [Planctomycetaceae bacterium]